METNLSKPTNHDLKKLQSIVEGGVAKANYYTIVESEASTGCSLCKYRCQLGACSMDDYIATIDLSKCIGCGICVTSCPNDTITFKLKPVAEIVPHLLISRHGKRSGCAIADCYDKQYPSGY